jgi:hypothetical protein
MRPTSVVEDPDDLALAIDATGVSESGAWDLEWGECPSRLHKAVRPLSVVEGPDDLTLAIDTIGLGIGAARDLNGGERIRLGMRRTGQRAQPQEGQGDQRHPGSDHPAPQHTSLGETKPFLFVPTSHCTHQFLLPLTFLARQTAIRAVRHPFLA